MKLIRKHEQNGTTPGGWFIGGYSFGFERSVIRRNGQKYMGRCILYVGNHSFRLHKFFQGDDESAPHDHPWPFWTFPLTRHGYRELVVLENGELGLRNVRGFHWHYRPSSHQHMVLNPVKPFYTLVVTSRKDRGWGFWPDVCWDWTVGRRIRKFVPWREWVAGRPQ